MFKEVSKRLVFIGVLRAVHSSLVCLGNVRLYKEKKSFASLEKSGESSKVLTDCI